MGLKKKKKRRKRKEKNDAPCFICAFTPEEMLLGTPELNSKSTINNDTDNSGGTIKSKQALDSIKSPPHSVRHADRLPSPTQLPCPRGRLLCISYQRSPWVMADAVGTSTQHARKAWVVCSLGADLGLNPSPSGCHRCGPGNGDDDDDQPRGHKVERQCALLLAARTFNPHARLGKHPRGRLDPP